MKHKLKTIFTLTAFSVLALFIVNKCVSALAVVKNLLSKNGGKFYKWRFGDIYYTKSGKGSPILLIHDLNPFASSYEWKAMAEILSKEYTVYTIDLLGCGRSSKPNLTYTNFLYVQMISDFVKNVIGQRCDVMATGLSSSFVVMACHNDSELFNKIFMVNPEKLLYLSGIPGKRSKVIKYIMCIPIIGASIYHMFVNRENLEYLFTEKYFYNPFKVTQKHLDVYHESAHLSESNGRFLLASLNGFYINANIKSALKKIDNSIYIIGGKRQENIEQIVDEYTSVNLAIESVLIPDTKLLPHLEAPDKFYRIFKIFQ